MSADVKMENRKFWHLRVEDTARLLATDTEKGLSAVEAKERLAKFGLNTISVPRRAVGLKIFLSQLTSPLILVLIVAALITLAISHYRDAVFILIAVLVNSILGFYQESKAERALAGLKTYLKQRARVIRDGQEREIDATELVPGDIIRLAQGDRVPADARVIFLNDFQVDEAVLTGESLPVSKSVRPSTESAGLADQHSMVFAGTLVTQGIGAAIVCRTDSQTELGQIASLIADSENEKTPLQKAIITFSIYSSIVLGAFTLVVFGIGILAGYSIFEMFLTSVAIAVSAIPEGLPVSMTVILAVGVERMAKRKGVVRRLVAAETLGSTTVILTDKTGTLTMARMALSQIIPIGKISEQDLITLALTNANVLIENPHDSPDAWRMSGRTMETALVRAMGLRGMSADQITAKKSVLQTRPFNAVQKFSVSLIKESGKYLLVFFGAPDILANHSSLNATEKEALLGRIDSLASNGEHVLGIATKEISYTRDFSFLKHLTLSQLSLHGLISFRDPIRPGIRQAIVRVRDAGVKTVILTGDHRGTAVAVARELGLETNSQTALDAAELTRLSDAELRDRLPRLVVISRVTPFEKLRIAKLYQEMGEVVAMTGDGVNDAPSIKQADVGIAMGSGTEVAQSVADLVLLDDNFETIVAAIEEGRQILANIQKVLVYLLSNVTDGLMLIGGALLTGLPLPLNALQILWVNFFTDSFPAVSYAFEKGSDGLSHRPHRGKIKLFDPLMKFLILAIGLSTSALLFVIYFTLIKLGYDESIVRTFTFAAFGTYTLLMSLSVRSLRQSILAQTPFSNKYLNGGIGIGLALMAAAIYHPGLQAIFKTVSLPFGWVIGVAVVGLLNIVLIELAKNFFRKHA